MEDFTKEEIEKLIRESERYRIIKALADNFEGNLDVVVRRMEPEDDR